MGEMGCGNKGPIQGYQSLVRNIRDCWGCSQSLRWSFLTFQRQQSQTQLPWKCQAQTPITATTTTTHPFLHSVYNSTHCSHSASSSEFTWLRQLLRILLFACSWVSREPLWPGCRLITILCGGFSSSIFTFLFFFLNYHFFPTTSSFYLCPCLQ